MNDIIETSKEDLELYKIYASLGKLHPENFPVLTYELVQCGYPIPTEGKMIARLIAGSDEQGRLLCNKAEWCKVEDVKRLLSAAVVADAARWRKLLQMVDECKISLLVEDNVDTIDGSEIITDTGEIIDIIDEYE